MLFRHFVEHLLNFDVSDFQSSAQIFYLFPSNSFEVLKLKEPISSTRNPLSFKKETMCAHIHVVSQTLGGNWASKGLARSSRHYCKYCVDISLADTHKAHGGDAVYNEKKHKFLKHPQLLLALNTGCSLNIVFFQEFSNVCHLSLASTQLLLAVQKITSQ